jgi:hypothetical protein
MDKNKRNELLKNLIPWLLMAAGIFIISFGHKNILLIIPGLTLAVLGYKKEMKSIRAQMWPAYMEDLESFLKQGTDQDNEEGRHAATDDEILDFMSRMFKKIRGVDGSTGMNIVNKVLDLLQQYRPRVYNKFMAIFSSVEFGRRLNRRFSSFGN